MNPREREANRIRAEYERREREIGREVYALTRPENLFFRQSQQRALRDALARASLLPLGERSVLDVGCGVGKWLATFEDFGARRERMAGVDLDPGRVAEARARFPGADLQAGDASQLPWPDGRFDIVFQSLVFTSILDDAMRAAVAREMRRVLAAGGTILWYDFSYNNPANPHVRGVGRAEIARLFPDCTVELARTTLAPPLVRGLAPRAWLAAALLERLRVLNTHYFGIIRPR
ncbi:MAG TPA: class I SAM-dependent methyltransferase [Kofleriaceae bacterium]|nr:class I SAM-dependent methyltransferase [Kofleriaceae bacterium]